MAIYRQVHMSFWTDPKVTDEFTPEEKYFYLYLITNPHTNICGCYEVSIKQIVWETGYNDDTVLRLLTRMSDVHHVISYDEETREILILNWYKYNWNKSPKLNNAVLEGCKKIKSETFRDYITYKLYDIPYTYPIHTSIDTTVTVTDTVPVTDTASGN